MMASHPGFAAHRPVSATHVNLTTQILVGIPGRLKGGRPESPWYVIASASPTNAMTFATPHAIWGRRRNNLD